MQKKILVIRFGSLGDVILTSATVLNLKLSYPDSHLVYLTKERFRSLVENFDGVDEVCTLSDEGGAVRYYRLLSQLDSMNFNLVVDLHGNVRSWLAAKMLTSDQAVVYPKRRIERRMIVRRQGKRIPKAWPHTIDLYNDCLEQLGGRVHCRRPIVPAGPESEQVLPFDSSRQPTVVIAPGAAHPNKQWEREKFIEVAQRLFDLRRCRIVWMVTSEQQTEDSRHPDLHEDYLTELVDCPLDKLAGVIARCDLTVANDSGLMHLSSAVGTPVVALFGPTHQSLGFAPRGLHDRVVEVDQFCRPCSLHGRTPCYRDKRYCFGEISSDMVVAQASEMLEIHRGARPALFVDRDGTIIIDKHFLSDPDLVELLPGAAGALKTARDAGFRIVVISNQSGVARGYFGIDEVEQVNGRMLELLYAEGVEVDGLYFCPYYADGTVTEYAIDSELRKPSPGMVEQAVRDLDIDLRRSTVIGDKLDDVNLGRVAGVSSLLVRTGKGIAEESKWRTYANVPEERVFDDLAAAVKHIVR